MKKWLVCWIAFISPFCSTAMEMLKLAVSLEHSHSYHWVIQLSGEYTVLSLPLLAWRRVAVQLLSKNEIIVSLGCHRQCKASVYHSCVVLSRFFCPTIMLTLPLSSKYVLLSFIYMWPYIRCHENKCILRDARFIYMYIQWCEILKDLLQVYIMCGVQFPH